MRPLSKNSDGLITFRGCSCCGGGGLRLGNAYRQGRGPQLLWTSTLCPPSDLYSSSSKRYPPEAPGDRCGAGMPSRILQEGGESQIWEPEWLIQGHQQVSGQARGSPCSCSPAWMSCVIFQSSGVSPSRSSILLTLNVGWTDSKEQRLERKMH